MNRYPFLLLLLISTTLAKPDDKTGTYELKKETSVIPIKNSTTTPKNWTENQNHHRILIAFFHSIKSHQQPATIQVIKPQNDLSGKLNHIISVLKNNLNYDEKLILFILVTIYAFILIITMMLLEMLLESTIKCLTTTRPPSPKQTPTYNNRKKKDDTVKLITATDDIV